MSVPATKTKALCVATRCTSVEQFIETFQRFCDESSFFVATLTSRTVGLETPFAIQLADRTPVLRGICIVLDAWATSDNKFKRPGIRLGIKRLTPDSAATYARLREAALGVAMPVAAPPPPRPASPPMPLDDGPTVTDDPMAMHTAVTKEVPRAVEVDRAPAPAPLRPLTDAEAWMADRVPEPAAAAAPRVLIEPRRAGRSRPAIPPATVAPSPITPLGVAVVAVQPVDLAAVAAPILTGEIPPPGADGRTPGSELVLPANPLMDLTDESIGGFVDCTLYEETANFVSDARSDEVLDPLVPAPAAASPATAEPAAARPLSTDAPVAFVPVDALGRRTTIPPWMAIPPPGAPRVEAPPPAPTALLAVAARPDLEPARRRIVPRWLIVAAPIALAAAAGIAVLAGAFDDAPAAPLPRPAVAKVATPPPVIAEPEPAADEAAPEPPDAVDVGDETESIGSMPVVGDGPCLLNITTTPAGSNIVVDGRAIGPSPLTMAGPCQRRKVDVVHPRYKPATQWVNLVADKPSVVDIRLARPTHTLAITTFPIGATVSIGGRRAGTSPTMVQVMGYSNVTIKVEKPGWKPVTTKVYSKDAKDKLFVRLAR